jgi:thiol-disulfide isomerase/thioredoxin
MKFIVGFLIALMGPGFLLAQKKFEVSVVGPDSTNLKKLSFEYFDCELGDDVPVTAVYSKSKATISHSYNTVHPQIWISYNNYELRIYTTKNPATVKLSTPFDEKNPFKDCVLTNAVDCSPQFSAEQAYVREAQKHYQQVYDSLAPNWKPTDTLDYQTAQDAKMAIETKRLEYIKQHANDYNAFIAFRQRSMKRLPPDSLLQEYTNIFPANIRNSEEGNSIKQYILNRVSVDGKRKAVSFTAEDIDHNKIVLKDIYSKKYVLLVFWGTWCGPCISEIPMFREIRKQYSKKQLEIISVADASPIELVRKYVKDEQMDWIHIANDPKIGLLYHVMSHPEAVLIDNKGNIIYRYLEYPDLNSERLKKTLADGLGNH